MFRAAVPEATVHEDCNSLAWEHDVCFSAEVGERSTMNTKAESAPVQLRAKPQLFCRISLFLLRQARACPR